MAEHTSTFNGQFENGCQIKFVPWASLAVVNMIVHQNWWHYHSSSSHSITDACFFCKQGCKPSGRHTDTKSSFGCVLDMWKIRRKGNIPFHLPAFRNAWRLYCCQICRWRKEWQRFLLLSEWRTNLGSKPLHVGLLSYWMEMVFGWPAEAMGVITTSKIVGCMM